MSITNPLAVTQAYAARLAALGGVIVRGDARSLHRRWALAAGHGGGAARRRAGGGGARAVRARRTGPLGIRLPLGIKRGYHRHYRPAGNAALSRPVVDIENGYCLAPMEQGIRLTTGAEFAPRDAPPTPVQLDRLLPAAQRLFPLGQPVEASPWMGSRPCFPDPGRSSGARARTGRLWLAYGHAHWGLTLGPATGRPLAEMMTGATPFCDPAPYGRSGSNGSRAAL